MLFYNNYLTVLLLLFTFLITSCYQPDLQVQTKLDAQKDYSTSVAFLNDNRSLYICNSNVEHEIYNCQTGEKMFKTNSPLVGIIKNRYILTDYSDIWDLKNGVAHKPNRAIPSAIVVFDQHDKFKYILTAEKGYGEPFFFNNYSWAIRLVHYDRHRANNDSVDVIFYKSGGDYFYNPKHNEPALVIKILKSDVSFEAFPKNDTLIVIRENDYNGETLVQINPQSGKIINLDNGKNYFIDFKPERSAQDQIYHERDFYEIEMQPAISQKLGKSYSIIAHSRDKSVSLVENGKSGFLEIASKASITDYPVAIQKAKSLRSKIVLILIVGCVIIYLLFKLFTRKKQLPQEHAKPKQSLINGVNDLKSISDVSELVKIARNKNTKQKIRIAAIDKMEDKDLLKTIYDSVVLPKIKNHLEEKIGIQPVTNLDKQSDEDKTDRNGRTKLHRAVLKKDPNMVKSLLHNGYDSNARDFDKATPLILAAEHQCGIKVAETLLKFKRGYIDYQDAGGKTALYYAVINQDVEMVELLLVYGANVHIQVNYENSLLMETTHPKIVKLLIDAGARADDLFGAVLKGEIESLKLLHKAGADIHQTDMEGNSLLDIANQINNKEAIEYLKPYLDKTSDTYDYVNSNLGLYISLPKNAPKPNTREFIKSFGFESMDQVDTIFRNTTGGGGQLNKQSLQKKMLETIGKPNSGIDNMWFSKKGIFKFDILTGHFGIENKPYNYIKCLYFIPINEKEKYIEVIAVDWEMYTHIDYLRRKKNVTRGDDGASIFRLSNELLQQWVRQWQHWRKKDNK